MKAAEWLYDDDITAARAMIAEIERRETNLIRSNSVNEINLLKRTIETGQVKAANYSVDMPYSELILFIYPLKMLYFYDVLWTGRKGDNHLATYVEGRISSREIVGSSVHCLV